MISFCPIPAYVVYPNSANSLETLKTLLRTLNRSDALSMCAQLNAAIASFDNLKNQATLVRSFFTTKQIYAINAYVNLVKTDQLPGVFYRSQLLELIRWICLYSSDSIPPGTLFNDSKLIQVFSQAALIASDLAQSRIYRTIQSVDEVNVTRENSIGPLRMGFSESAQPRTRSGRLVEVNCLISSIFLNSTRVLRPNLPT